MASSSKSDIISCKQEDYLDADPPLRGQNYACLSFLSPENVLKRKETFMFENFLKDFSRDMNEFFENLSAKYPDDKSIIKSVKDRYNYVFDPSLIEEEYAFFIRMNGEKLEKDYLEQNNFQTTIRGLKVRGVFDTRREAEIRAQVLKKLDDKFNVYVADVGCWLPWDPNPDLIEDQEFAESQLNTLMKKYKENQLKKDEFFQERLKEDALATMKSKLQSSDPWMNAKGDQPQSTESESASQSEPVARSEAVLEPESENVPSSEPEVPSNDV